MTDPTTLDPSKKPASKLILEQHYKELSHSAQLYYDHIKQQKKLDHQYLKSLPSNRLDKNIPIIKTLSYLSSSKWTYKQLSEYYQKSNTICLSNALGLKYIHSTNQIKRIHCNKFTCDRCRKLFLKTRLRDEIQRNILEKDLIYHIVITTEGYDNYRKDHDFKQSYKDMVTTWNKLRTRLYAKAKKQNKKLSFICLPRAQKNGYCHPHILTNIEISKKELKELVKIYENTGSSTITAHKNTAKYLTNDFLKDHEFYTPIGQRRYTTSRDIQLNIYKPEEQEEIPTPENEKINSTFMHLIPKPIPPDTMHIHLQTGINITDQIYTAIKQKYGYPPPFNIILSEFYGKVHQT